MHGTNNTDLWTMCWRGGETRCSWWGLFFLLWCFHGRSYFVLFTAAFFLWALFCPFLFLDKLITQSKIWGSHGNITVICVITLCGYSGRQVPMFGDTCCLYLFSTSVFCIPKALILTSRNIHNANWQCINCTCHTASNRKSTNFYIIESYDTQLLYRTEKLIFGMWPFKCHFSIQFKCPLHWQKDCTVQGTKLSHSFIKG